MKYSAKPFEQPDPAFCSNVSIDLIWLMTCPQTHLLPPLPQPPRSVTPPSPNKQHHSTAAAATAMVAAAAAGNYFGGGGYHTSPPPLVGGQFMGEPSLAI